MKPFRYKYAEITDLFGNKKYARYRDEWRYDLLAFECSKCGSFVRKCEIIDLYAHFGRPKRNGVNVPFSWRYHGSTGVEFCTGHDGLPTPVAKPHGKPHAVKSLSTSYLVGSGTSN